MSEIILGIDLGTTNSEVAIVRDGQPVVLTEEGDPILPSFVGLSEDGRLLVGRPARNQWAFAPDRTIKSIKRKMGEDVKVKLGDVEYRPQEISAMILRKLKERAERELGQSVSKAVITVPAYFNDTQRQATREAGELAGLEVVRILNEPTAAALTYNPDQTVVETILVYDLGGGTFDVSIVKTESGVVEVLSSHGDTHLGGDDFDEALMNRLCDLFKAEHGVDLRENNVSKARAIFAAEAAKRHLSDHPFARVEEEFIAEKDGVALHLNLEIARSDYETLIQPFIDRTMDCLQRALDDAKITAAEVNRVVLVGGSTRTPLVSHLLESRLGQPAHREINPDLCVAMGAAVQGAIIAGDNVGAVLVDITPHSMGIKCLSYAGDYGMPFEHHFAPIIERGTPLPASRSEVFSTVRDSQKSVEVDVYQGEHQDVRRNHRVGMFLIDGLAPVPAGNQLVVQLDLTLDGTLRVAAREKSTGLVKHITIDNAMARFERDERDEAVSRLDELWEGRENAWNAPEDDDDDDDMDDLELPIPGGELPSMVPGPREGQREAVQAKALLEKAARLRGQAAAEDQSELDRLMGEVQQALTDRQWDKLQTASNALSDVLFYLEDA